MKYENTFEELVKRNCFSADKNERREAAETLEYRYGCEIFCTEIGPDVLFAHHGRGCTIIAAKICSGVVIYQNVTMGSNMKYNRISKTWENVGSPIIAENVVVCDGAKILGPVIIGANSVIAAGAIVTKDIPPDSIAYGVNQYKPKNPDYDLVFHSNMISGEEIMKIDKLRVSEFIKLHQ